MLNYERDVQDINVKEKFIKEFGAILYKVNNEKKCNEIIFLCVGTDRITGDCFGPLVGDNLINKFKQYNISNIDIYGNLKENISYENISDKIKIIKQKYKNPCIVVIDAALSNKENIGKIFVNNSKTILGNGLNKNKIEIGDISIKAVVAKNHKLPQYNFKILQNISLYVVMTLANIVSDGIVEVIKYS